MGPAADRPGPCKQLWDAAGYQTEWPAYNQRLIAFEASQHSVHQLMVGLNQFDNGNALAASNVAQASAAGIGFGQQGLEARDITDIASNATVCPPTGVTCSASTRAKYLLKFSSSLTPIPRAHLRHPASAEPGDWSAASTTDRRTFGPRPGVRGVQRRAPACLRSELAGTRQIWRAVCGGLRIAGEGRGNCGRRSFGWLVP